MKDKKLILKEDLILELNNLKSRALKIGYKNIMPKFPDKFANYEETLAGFMYRLDNWKKQLIQLENPGGLPSNKPSLVNDIRHIVINTDEIFRISDNSSDV